MISCCPARVTGRQQLPDDGGGHVLNDGHGGSGRAVLAVAPVPHLRRVHGDRRRAAQRRHRGAPTQVFRVSVLAGVYQAPGHGKRAVGCWRAGCRYDVSGWHTGFLHAAGFCCRHGKFVRRETLSRIYF